MKEVEEAMKGRSVGNETRSLLSCSLLFLVLVLRVEDKQPMASAHGTV